MDLNHCLSLNELSSTGYCLADPGQGYLIFLPGDMRAEVDLTEAPGTYAVEWFDPQSGNTCKGNRLMG